MANAAKIVTTKSQARLSKLKNKRSQLENLLRSRERLDYEIKNLKKSIQKDQKIITEEILLMEETSKNIRNSSDDDETFCTILQESVVLEEGKNSRETFRKVLRILGSSQDELIAILNLLLKFAETL